MRCSEPLIVRAKCQREKAIFGRDAPETLHGRELLLPSRVKREHSAQTPVIILRSPSQLPILTFCVPAMLASPAGVVGCVATRAVPGESVQPSRVMQTATPRWVESRRRKISLPKSLLRFLPQLYSILDPRPGQPGPLAVGLAILPEAFLVRRPSGTGSLGSGDGMAVTFSFRFGD